MRFGRSLFVGSLLALAPVAVATLVVAQSAEAAMYRVAPVDEVAPLADLVVRGKLDAKTGVLAVERWYGPSLDVKELRIHGLGDLPKSQLEPGELGVVAPTDQVILFLHWQDGRAELLRTASPAWITPEASVLYLAGKDEVRVYRQAMHSDLPAPVVADQTRTALETQLDTLRKGKTLPRRPSLTPEQSRRFHEILEDRVDLQRGVAHEKRIWDEKAAEMTAQLAAFARSEKGVARRRAVEALLALGSQRGTPQPRRTAAETALVALHEAVGDDDVVPVLLEACERDSTSANKRSAAAVLRAIGGEPLAKGKDLLLSCLKSRQTNVVTNAYWGLVYLGHEAEAKAALPKDAK